MVAGAIPPPPSLSDDLKRRYAEPHRAYHTWAHIEALLQHARNNAHLIRRPTPLLWALLWHDAVYDPHRTDNEDQSAKLLHESATGILSSRDLALAESFVRATAQHELPSDLAGDEATDCALFLDFDLSILASSQAPFDRYEEAIRREYNYVPPALFSATRAAILKRFLERPALYFTPTLACQWEARARANLARSIARLTSSTS